MALLECTGIFCVKRRAVDPHSFFARSGSSCSSQCESGSSCFLMRIRIQLNKISNKLRYKEYSGVEKDEKDCSKVKNHGADPTLLTIMTNFLAFLKFFPQIFHFWTGEGKLVKRKLTEFVCPNVYLTVSHELQSKIQCFGSAYNIMQTRIQVQVKLHLEPDPDPEGKKFE